MSNCNLYVVLYASESRYAIITTVQADAYKVASKCQNSTILTHKQELKRLESELKQAMSFLNTLSNRRAAGWCTYLGDNIHVQISKCDRYIRRLKNLQNILNTAIEKNYINS